MTKVRAEIEQTLNYNACIEQTLNYTATVEYISVYVPAIWLLVTAFWVDGGAWLDDENWIDSL